MSYLDSHNLASDGEFLARFAAALTKGAADVIKESASTLDHASRLTLAVKVFNAPAMYAARISLGAAVEFGGISPTDAQMDALVAQYWSALALAPQVP